MNITRQAFEERNVTVVDFLDVTLKMINHHFEEVKNLNLDPCEFKCQHMKGYSKVIDAVKSIPDLHHEEKLRIAKMEERYDEISEELEELMEPMSHEERERFAGSYGFLPETDRCDCQEDEYAPEFMEGSGSDF